MRNTETVQFLFEGAIDSERFVALARHPAPRLDLHLALGPCARDGILPASGHAGGPADAFESFARTGLQDCVVHDIHRIGGRDDHTPSAMPR